MTRPCPAAGAALLALLVAALPGCGRDPQPAAPAAVSATVSDTDAANATYASEYTESGSLKLNDGHYEDSDLGIADLDTLDARGDLDGDGREDLVVLLVTSSGGTGVFRDLYVLRRNAAGQLSVSPPAFLGDRVDVNALRIERGQVVVDLVVQGPDDPLCCPTQAVTYRFRLANDGLVETSGQQRVYLGQ